MIVFLKKVWAWVKKYWKWLLFPIGIILALVGFIAGKASQKDPPAPDPVEPEDITGEVIAAEEERDRKLAELRQKNQARLESLSAEQQKELDELKDKPLEEVVSWFNKI